MDVEKKCFGCLVKLDKDRSKTLLRQDTSAKERIVAKNVMIFSMEDWQQRCQFSKYALWQKTLCDVSPTRF